MSKIYTNEAVYVAESVRNHLNMWDKRPADFELEKIRKKAPAMMVQQLSGTEKKKVYVNGSYVAEWRFAVYIRVNGEDTAARLDAVGCLEELARWLTELDSEGRYANIPIIDDCRTVSKIEMSSTPSIAARYDDGDEDYQALFTLEYKFNRRL